MRHPWAAVFWTSLMLLAARKEFVANRWHNYTSPTYGMKFYPVALLSGHRSGERDWGQLVDDAALRRTSAWWNGWWDTAKVKPRFSELGASHMGKRESVFHSVLPGTEIAVEVQAATHDRPLVQTMRRGLLSFQGAATGDTISGGTHG